MTTTELGLNQVSQYTDFNVKFSNITKDGSPLNFTTVGTWIFTMGATLSQTGVISKSTTGVASGDFSVVAASSYVSVGVRASEFGSGYGQYYCSLFAQTSGRRISHSPVSLHVVPQIQPGV